MSAAEAALTPLDAGPARAPLFRAIAPRLPADRELRVGVYGVLAVATVFAIACLAPVAGPCGRLPRARRASSRRRCSLSLRAERSAPACGGLYGPGPLPSPRQAGPPSRRVYLHNDSEIWISVYHTGTIIERTPL